MSELNWMMLHKYAQSIVCLKISLRLEEWSSLKEHQRLLH